MSKLVGFKAGENAKVSLPKGFASGTAQVLPGYTPGRDVHTFYSDRWLDPLSGGEGIARPELVRAIGADRWNAANKAARIGDVDKGMRYLGGFASGGIAAAENYAHSIGIRSIGTYPGHHPSMALARDFMTSSKSQGDRMAEWLWQNRRAINLYYEIWWRRIRSMTRESAGWTPYTRSNPHTDHVHGAWYSGGLSGAVGALRGVGAGVGAALDVGKYTGMVTAALDKLKSIKGTPFGQMVSGIATKIGDAVKTKMTELAATFNAGTGAAGAAAFTRVGGGTNRAIGHRMMLQRWAGVAVDAAQLAVDPKESGWRTTAQKPEFGRLRHSAVAARVRRWLLPGADWRSNPATQIKWGLDYIASRYGSPAAAWAHSQRNWMVCGGTPYAPPGWAVVGEQGPELVRFRGGEQVLPNGVTPRQRDADRDQSFPVGMSPQAAAAAAGGRTVAALSARGMGYRR